MLRNPSRIAILFMLLGQTSWGYAASPASTISGGSVLAPGRYAPRANASALARADNALSLGFEARARVVRAGANAGLADLLFLGVDGSYALDGDVDVHPAAAFKLGSSLALGIVARSAQLATRTYDASISSRFGDWVLGGTLQNLAAQVNALVVGAAYSGSSVRFAADLYKRAPIQDLVCQLDLTLGFSVGSVAVDFGADFAVGAGGTGITPHGGLRWQASNAFSLFAAYQPFVQSISPDLLEAGVQARF